MTKYGMVTRAKERVSRGHPRPILKGRDTSVPSFLGSLYLCPNGLSCSEKFSVVTRGRKTCLYGSPMLPILRDGPHCPQIFETPYLHPNGLNYSNQFWHSNTRVRGRVSRRSSTPPIRMWRGGTASQKFGAFYMHTRSMRNRNRILHGDQSRLEEYFHRVDSTRCLGQNFCDTNVLFVAANSLVLSFLCKRFFSCSRCSI